MLWSLLKVLIFVAIVGLADVQTDRLSDCYVPVLER